MKSKPTSQY